MRGNKNSGIPEAKKYISISKKQFKKFIEKAAYSRREIFSIRRDIRKLIEEEVKKNLDGKVVEIKAAIKESIVHKEILIDKGILTRDEVNKKHEELAKKRK